MHIKRKYKIKKVNKGWFKKGQKPHNAGKSLTEIEKKKLSRLVKKAMARLPEQVKKRIQKHQFKKGNYYAHWKGKFGEEHPNYKGIAYRNKILSIKKKQCEKCGKKKFRSLSQLHVHHKDHNRKNQNLNNLQLLCTKCHTSLHKNWRFRWARKE